MNHGYAVIGSSTVSKAQKIRKRKLDNKKMKLTWRQKLRNWLNKDYEDQDLQIPHQVELESSSSINSEGMRFELHRASGGYVIETRYYDQKTDRHYNKLYIVNDDKDIGHEIGKIITLESLR